MQRWADLRLPITQTLANEIVIAILMCVDATYRNIYVVFDNMSYLKLLKPVFI